jgi:hypothetical protein
LITDAISKFSAAFLCGLGDRYRSTHMFIPDKPRALGTNVGEFMNAEKNTIRTTDFEEFYDRNEPDNAGELACLYRSVVNISDESFFETKEMQNQGKVTHHVIASSDDVLILTAKSYPAFVNFIESQNSDPELGIEEAADFEYSINNPHS